MNKVTELLVFAHEQLYYQLVKFESIIIKKYKL